MNLLTTDWDFRSLWMLWPVQTKVYLVCLFAAALYSVISSAQTFLRIGKLPRVTPETDAETTNRRFSARLHNLRQLHLLFLLLFGLFLTDEAFRTAQSFVLSRMSLEAPTIPELLAPLLAFAFISLLVLTILHSLQWFVSSRLDANILKSKTSA